MTGHSETIRFDGMTAIVTGAGRGLGKAYAQFLAERGANVVVNSRTAGPANEVAAAINASDGGRAVVDTHVVGTKEAADAIVQAALNSFGRIDIVVNNAGYAHNDAFDTITPDILDDQIRVHLGGAFWLNQAVWPLMKAAKYGRIVNTTSGTILGFPDSSGYLSAKAAVIGMNRAQAYEGEAFGIRVNCVSPLARTMETSGHAAFDTMQLKWDARSVAPLVALLAHETCPTTGKVFTVGGGRVGMLFFGETPGFVDPNLTPESLAAHFDQVEDRSTYQMARDAPEAVQMRMALVEQAIAAASHT